MGEYSLYVWPAFIISLTILSIHLLLIFIQFKTISKTYKIYKKEQQQ